MKALTVPGYGWQNHPAVRMWRGYETSLLDYQSAICYEWHDVRGYKDTCYSKIVAIWCDAEYTKSEGVPPWLGNEELHASHRSNLLRKDEEWYRQFGWSEPTTLEYVWPV